MRYATAVAVALWAVSSAAATPPEGVELIGTAAAPWDTMEWLNSPPLTLDQLQGKVALIRWWTGPECPHCVASAPYWNAWQWTSVSFLIDRQGRIRYIHPGGSYSATDAKAMETLIQQLLTPDGGSL